ncbi:MAG: segregation and condensation protein A [Chlamydiales bacterium]|jgi:segregation and condensation protein A
MLKSIEDYSFSLENFEGPLDLLLYLVQKRELDIYQVPILEIMEQYIAYLTALTELSIDAGAEFLGTTASLMHIKSQMLLPRKLLVEDEADIDPRFELVQQLLEYYQVKGLANDLSIKESQQSSYFSRGMIPFPSKGNRAMGIDHLSLCDLGDFFKEAMKKVSSRKGANVHEEEWRVSDKISWITKLVEKYGKISLLDIFPTEHCRGELIVTFLALLELMKTGGAMAMRDPDTSEYFVCKNEELAIYANDGN